MNKGAHTSSNGQQAPADDDVVSVVEAEGDTSVADPASGADASTPAEQAPVGMESSDDEALAGHDEAGTDVASEDEARLKAAEARADDNWDRLLRLQADMENQRKRAQRDVNNARKFALEGIVGDLLPVRDSLEMGLAAASEEGATIESLREGADLTLKMLAAALEKHNIVAIDPVGEKFNPEFHQAMTMQPVEGAAPNTVVSVMQKGYTLNERLIRPALVMVAK